MYTLLKIIVVGDTNCGKTTISYKFISDVPQEFAPTIGIEFMCKRFNLNSRDVKVHVWDTAGQERFRSITKSYYNNSDACILCFKLNNKYSFLNLKSYMSDIQKLCEDDIPIYLVGTFADQIRDVTNDDITDFMENHSNILRYFEIDCLKDDVDKIFNGLVSTVLDRTPITLESNEYDSELIDLVSESKSKYKKNCLCYE